MSTKPAASLPCPRCPCRRNLRLWGVMSVLLVVGALVFARTVHPFLAPVAVTPARVMVVEGWLPDYALETAAEEFRRGGYERIYATGGPLPRGSHLSAYRTYAELSAATLLKLGIASNAVVAVPSERRERNRTFASAVALRDHLQAGGTRLESLNLISLGAHSRRSRLCFQRAFGPSVPVGVLAITNQEYDPEAWWRSSEGVKNVGGELLGFAYAWLSIDLGP